MVPHLMLTGDSLCEIIDVKKNMLTGEKIVIQPRRQLAHVIGPGTLHSVGEPVKGAAPARRVVVPGRWT